jgi:cobalt-zinc-cadmium efflux system outer membrane protein
MKTEREILPMKRRRIIVVAAVVLGSLGLNSAFGQAPVKITLEQAIDLAVKHNHALQAARTTIQQSKAAEITAYLRPNPTIFTDWEYLPISKLPGESLPAYLQGSTEGDLGMSYLIERGKKRQRRLQAARDATAVTRSQVFDNERTLGFQVGQLFYNVLLAESVLDLANTDLKSFQATVDISERQYKIGAISQNDYLQIKLQLVQFQTNAEQAILAREQALSDLRQQLGYESVPADYGVVGEFAYRPLAISLDELQLKALQNRPDLRAAVLGVTAANSQYALAKANGKQDPTISGNYSHVNGINAVTWSFSIPLAIFDRNQGNIAQTRVAIRQAEEQQKAASGQVLTDVRDAYVGAESNGRVTKIYVSGVLDDAKLSRDISEYSYRHGATALLDFLVAQRNYDAIELAYRQSLAAYLTSIEQLRQAVGSRSLQ